MAYNNAIPQPNDKLSVSQPQLLGNFQEIAALVAVNHQAFNQPPNSGKHTLVQFLLQGVDPALTVGDLNLYNFNNATTTRNELYIGLADGTKIPMTATNRSANGYTWLPSGILLQWGTTTRAASATPIPFALTFPHACLDVIVSASTDLTSKNTASVVTGTITTTNFQARAWALGGTHNDELVPISFLAIGW